MAENIEVLLDENESGHLQSRRDFIGKALNWSFSIGSYAALSPLNSIASAFTHTESKTKEKLGHILDEVKPRILDSLRQVWFIEMYDNNTLYDRRGDRFSLDSGTCDVSSAITRHVLKEKNLHTEYRITFPSFVGKELLNSRWKTFRTEPDKYRPGISYGHILLKSGGTFIDPTYLQFYDPNPKQLPRILTGNHDKIKSFLTRHPFYKREKSHIIEYSPEQAIKEYLDSMTDPNRADPNWNLLYPSALDLEKQLEARKNNPDLKLHARVCTAEDMDSIKDNPYYSRFKIQNKPRGNYKKKCIYLD